MNGSFFRLTGCGARWLKLEKLSLYHSTRGEFETAIEYTRRWLTIDPLHEPAHRFLMQLYAWSGQRAAALSQYEECVRTYNEELNAAPLEATTELYERIKRQRSDPMATLRVVSGPGAPVNQRFVLREGTSIGYSRRNDIRLDDEYVSGAHARIEHKPRQYILRDLKSTNGTKVNGQEVFPRSPCPLTHGDEIEIGDTLLIFEQAEHQGDMNSYRRDTSIKPD